MNNRLELQKTFEELIGSRNVYFQPPSNVHMNYPCIVYFRESYDTEHANDKVYKSVSRYKVTYIDPDPDSIVPLTLLGKFSMISPRTSFASDNLNHYVFDLYF